MTTKISTAEVGLNNPNNLRLSIIIENECGTLIVDKELYVISFNEKPSPDITICNKREIATIIE